MFVGHFARYNGEPAQYRPLIRLCGFFSCQSLYFLLFPEESILKELFVDPHPFFPRFQALLQLLETS